MIIDTSLCRLQIAIVGTALLFFSPFWKLDDVRYYMFHFPKFFFLSLVTFTLISGIRKNQKKLEPLSLSWSELGFFIYLLIGVFSMISSGKVPWTNNIEWLARYLLPVLIYICARQNGKSSREVVENTILACATILAAFVWCEAMGLISFQSPRAPVGTLGSRNYVALYLTICFPLAVKRTFSSGRKWRSGGLIFVWLTAVVLTRSRAAWGILSLQAFLGIMFYFFGAEKISFSHRARKLWPVITPISIGLAFALSIRWKGLRWREANPYWSSLTRILNFYCGSGRFRLNEFAIGRSLLATKPLIGMGPESWRTAAPLFTHAAANEHSTEIVLSMRNSPNSDFIRILSETGLLGAGLLGAAILLFFWQFLRKSERANPAYLLPILSVILFAFVDTPFCRPEILCLVPVLVWLADGQREPSPFSMPSFVAKSLTVAAAIFCVVVYGLLFASFVPLVKSADLNHLIEAQRIFPLPSRDLLIAKIASTDMEHCSMAREEMDRIVREAPNNYMALTYEARCKMLFGDLDSAVIEYNKAILLEPHDDAIRREFRSWIRKKPTLYTLGSTSGLWSNRESCF
jgi:hypothetical protein